MDLVTFEADDRSFLIDAARVREVVARVPVEPFPDAPEGVVGRMSLRGERVPVVELHRRLGAADAGRGGPVLIVDHPDAGAIGLRVDSVGEVRDSHDRPVLPIPSYFGGTGAWLRGLVADGDRLSMLVDPAGLLAPGEAAALVSS